MRVTIRNFWLFLLVALLARPAVGLAQDTLTAARLAITFLRAQATPAGQVEVTALVSVLGDNGRPLSSLTAADFTVSENNAPVPTGHLTASPVDLPLSVALLVDTGQPMAEPGPDGVRLIDTAKDAAITFVDHLKDGDQIAVYGYSRGLQPRQEMTYDHNLAIDRGITPLDAGEDAVSCLNDALEAVLQTLTTRPDTPRLVVVITTRPALTAGEGCGIASVDDLLDIPASLDDIVPIYPIAVGEASQASELVRLARRSGGQAFFAAEPAGLPLQAEALAGLLKQQYRLTYTSQALPGLARVIIFENSTEKSDRQQVVIPAVVEPTPTPPPPFTIGLTVDQPSADRLTLRVTAPEGVVLTETELFVDDQPVEHRTVPPLDRFELDINALGGGTHLVRIEATAEDGATATAEVELTLTLPPTPTPVPSPTAVPPAAETGPLSGLFARFGNMSPTAAFALVGLGVLLVVGVLLLAGFLLFFRRKRRPVPAPAGSPPLATASPGPVYRPPVSGGETLVDVEPPTIPVPHPADEPDAGATLVDVEPEELDEDKTLVHTPLPAAVPQARLVTIAGEMMVDQAVFIVTGPETGIGRNTAKNQQNEIDIRDKEVSRRHARITLQDGQFYLEDLGSSTGTALNGQRLAPHRPVPLQDGAEISVGPRVQFRFELSGPAAGTATLLDVEEDARKKYGSVDPHRTVYD